MASPLLLLQLAPYRGAMDWSQLHLTTDSFERKTLQQYPEPKQAPQHSAAAASLLPLGAPTSGVAAAGYSRPASLSVSAPPTYTTPSAPATPDCVITAVSLKRYTFTLSLDPSHGGIAGQPAMRPMSVRWRLFSTPNHHHHRGGAIRRE